MNEETKIVSFAKKLDSFLATYKAIITLMAICVVFSAAQLIMFFTTGTKVDGETVNGVAGYGSDNIKSWLYLVASISTIFFGCLFSWTNVVGSKYYLVWNIAFVIASTVLLILGFSIMALVSLLYGFLSSIARSFLWRNNTIEKLGWTKKGMAIGIVVFGIIIVILLNIVATFCGDALYGGLMDGSSGEPWMRYFDATGGALEITGYTFLMFRCNWAFLAFILCKVSYIIFWVAQGNVVTTVQMIVFGCLDASGLILWTLVHTKESLTDGAFKWDENGKPVAIQ